MMDEAEHGTDDGTIYGATIPFARLCGIEALEVVEGRTRLRLALGPQHGNNLGIAHGGILCTLLDIAMGTVARLTAGRPVVTLDMQTRFLSPGHGVLLAEGRVARAGQSILFCDAEICDEAGRVVATSTGVFKPVGVKEQAKA
ncbi:thioesterase [Methylobacterium aquaticum]|uniref:Thioesterase n=3 Tax=Methylobacteriaceae TaxID=119045 RepID=A0A0C6FKS8_9HYPH|nr:thioesterase [Methylobacterium aquaticum]